MLKQVTGTIVSRVFVTTMNLLVMMLAGHALGSEGLGTISLIVLGITLIMLPASLMGAGSLTYLAPRAPMRAFVPRAFAWGIICVAMAYLVLRYWPSLPVVGKWSLVPPGYEAHACALALLQVFYSINLAVLIGQRRVFRHNLITSLHALTLLFAFACALHFHGGDPFAYVIASYAAFSLTLVLSSIAIFPSIKPTLKSEKDIPRFMLRQGIISQSANTFQLLNYRLAYWLIEHFRGRAALGLYSVGNQLAESAWIAPRSMSLVLYSHVSGTNEVARQRTLTLAIAKASIAFALIVVLVLFITPDALFRSAFGKDITGLRPIALLLAPGILCMAASQAFSGYFSGIARNTHNLIGSGLGLLVTAGLGTVLVPRYALHGAAITASCAYATSVIYQIIVFMRTTHSTAADLLPNARDVERVRELWRTMRR